MAGHLPWVIITLLGLVMTTAQVLDEGDTTLEYPRRNPEIVFLHITSDIISRFVTTQVTSQLTNTANEGKEAVFYMRVPKNAFITNFTMQLDGKTYIGEVKEKQHGKQQYFHTKSQGKSGSLLSKKARNTHAFKVAINVAAASKVSFNLTYQELLQRRLGVYEHIINITPYQVVRDLCVTVNIQESRPITVLTVPPLRRDVNDIIQTGSSNRLAHVQRLGPSHAQITFTPSPREQVELSAEGISAQFTMQYDVERHLDAGELQVKDGYFVHYFAPINLEPVPKNIFFLLDISGSMSGTKLAQTRGAMRTIISDLRSKDRFNLVHFSTSVKLWRMQPADASTENKAEAITYVQRLQAEGGTNINDALSRGLEYLLREIESQGTSTPPRTNMIIFLTDGIPSAGVTNLDRIQANVRDLNQGKVTIFSLGFGHGVDFPFLQKLSLQNRGLARRIYEDADAELQLEGFYNEVSTPVLTHVNITYPGNAVNSSSLTNTDFNAFYQGSEIVVAGRLRSPSISSLDSSITATSVRGDVGLDTRVSVPLRQSSSVSATSSSLSLLHNRSFHERLWAYLTIKKLLEEVAQSSDPSAKEDAREKALQLSLKYSFVTPLTSMVVKRPGEPQRSMQADDPDGTDEKHLNRQPKYVSKHAHRGRLQGRNSFVDNDPHFLVSISGWKEAMCFDVTGIPGDIYQLVYDPIKGVAVNGEIVGRGWQTWFGRLAIICQGHLVVDVSPRKIHISGVGEVLWRKRGSYNVSCATVNIQPHRSVEVSCGSKLDFTVLRHCVRQDHPTKVDFLGFYIQDGSGLSTRTHGLIGQFQYYHIHPTPSNNPPSSHQEVLEFLVSGPEAVSRRLHARRRKRRNMVMGSHEWCWHVRNNGHNLITGHHTDYIVPRINYQTSSWKHRKYTEDISLYSHNLPTVPKSIDPITYNKTEDMFVT